MKVNRIAQLCAIVFCIGSLPGCYWGDKNSKKEKSGPKKEMSHKKEHATHKKSMNKEYKNEK
jgi:hypothetical protein